MKNIPLGNGALSIAHPSHEIRIHGFLKRAKPFGFVMTDGSGRTHPHNMYCFQNYFRGIHSGNDDAFMMMFNGKDFIEDSNLYAELIAGRHQAFEAYVKLLANNMIRKKIDYVVADASEGYNVIHEMCRITTNLAVRYVEKTSGRKIMNYEFSIVNPYNELLTEDCIHIELTEKELDEKLTAFAMYHPSVFTEFKNSISIDEKVLSELQKAEGGVDEIKRILLLANPEYFKNEYIRPYKYKKSEGKPFYEMHGEALVGEGVYDKAISYEEHIKPVLDAVSRKLKLV